MKFRIEIEQPFPAHQERFVWTAEIAEPATDDDVGRVLDAVTQTVFDQTRDWREKVKLCR